MTNGITRQWYFTDEPKGLVAIDIREDEDKKRYNPHSMTGFLFSHDLGWYNSLDEAIARTGRELTPLEDLGDYPLHFRFDPSELRLEVAAVEFRGSQRVLAKNVPAMSYLFHDADTFFRLWRGRNAVSEVRTLLVSDVAIA